MNELSILLKKLGKIQKSKKLEKIIKIRAKINKIKNETREINKVKSWFFKTAK